MKILSEPGLSLMAVVKYMGEVILCVGLFSLVISSPIIPWMLACQYESGYWMLLYIPIAIFWGAHLRNRE